MKTLELPDPAAGLWLETRDVLNNLGSGRRPWVTHLGGGTIIAARIRHRESTDIDIVIQQPSRLTSLTLKDENNLAKRLGGEPIQERETQIKVRLAQGVIDLNTVPIRPHNGAERVRISDRVQRVLSTTQILRGKFERATDPAPVRDVYDIIRLGQDEEFDDEVTAAYGLIPTETQDAIENMWARLDEEYEQQAGCHLKLREAPAADLKRLGSIGAATLNGHRLTRVVVELDQDVIHTERKTRNGKRFTEESHADRTLALHNRNGITEVLAANGLDSRTVSRKIAICRAKRLNGVIFDSADIRPLDRFTGKNTSMKRHEAAAKISGRTLTPPSAEFLTGKGDHSKDENVVRGKGRPVGVTTKKRARATTQTPGDTNGHGR